MGVNVNALTHAINQKIQAYMFFMQIMIMRNDDSVSVEELDWSAESQVLIPAEHLWCDFKCRP